MKSITFPEATNKIAENQPEYNTVISQWNPEEQSVNLCFELDEEEFAEIARTRKVWYKQLTFGKSMNPIRLSPFKNQMIESRKKIQTLNDIDITSPEGKLLFASMVTLTTDVHPDKTPEEVLEILKAIQTTIPFEQ